MKLGIIVASTRPTRVGHLIGQWVHERAVEHGEFDIELLDLAKFNLPLYDEPKHPSLQQYEHDHRKRWSASVAAEVSRKEAPHGGQCRPGHGLEFYPGGESEREDCVEVCIWAGTGV